jgi:hypothetical protein
VAAAMNDQDHFSRSVEAVENKIGKTLLSEEDLLMLSCREIAKSFTREEKDYA